MTTDLLWILVSYEFLLKILKFSLDKLFSVKDMIKVAKVQEKKDD